MNVPKVLNLQDIRSKMIQKKAFYAEKSVEDAKAKPHVLMHIMLNQDVESNTNV